MKKALLAVAVLALAAIGIGAWWLHGNLDNLVKAAIQDHGSEMTRAKVRVGSVELRTTDGQGFVRGLVVGNPAGFKTAHALSVKEIEVAVELASLAKDVVVVKRIVISAPDVIYEKGEQMTNFDAIQNNIAAYLGPAKKDAAPGKKLIVEELIIRNARAQASAAFLDGKTVSVPLPDITLRDIGKAKGGVTPGELGQAVTGAIKQRLASAISFDRLMKGAGKAIQDTGKAIKDLFK
jgi:predicted small secreted protein